MAVGLFTAADDSLELRSFKSNKQSKAKVRLVSSGTSLSQHHTLSLERLNYETSELNICSKEAQLSHIDAQYSSKEAQIFPYEAKLATSKIMEYRQRLFIYNGRRQIIAIP